MKRKLKTILMTVLLLGVGLAQAKTVINYPTVASKPYTGLEQTVTVPDSSDYEVVSVASGTGVGGYDIYLYLTDSENTKWPDSDNEFGSMQWYVTKAANEWTTEPSIESWTYGDPASTPVATAKFGTPTVTFSGTAKDGTTYTDVSSVAKAGTYTCKFTVAGTSNYEGLDPVIKNFEIKVATPGGGGVGGSGNVDVSVTGYDGQYDGNDHQISIVITGDDAPTFTVTYSDAQEGPFKSENTYKYKEIGTYTVWYCLQSINYATVTNSAIVKISQREITPPTIASKEYNGAMQKADVTETADYTVEYNGEFKEAGTHEDAIVLALKDKTHCKWTDGAEDPVLLSFTITKSESNVWLTEPSITGWKYGEAAHIPVAVPKYGVVSVLYEGTTTDGTMIKDAMSVSKAGSYTAKFVVSESVSYNGLVEKMDFVVERGTIDVGTGGSGGAKLAVSDYVGKYDGQRHVPNISITGDESSSFEISYSLAEDGPYDVAKPNLVDVGGPTEIWYSIASPDYQSITNSANVTITKRCVTITSGDATKIYDGTPLRMETIVIGGDKFVAGEGVTATDFASITSVGSIPNEFSIVMNDNTKEVNYSISKSYGTLTIEKIPRRSTQIKIRCEWRPDELNHDGVTIICDVLTNGAFCTCETLNSSNEWMVDVDAPLYLNGKLLDYSLVVHESRCVATEVDTYGLKKLSDVYIGGRVVTKRGYRVLSGMIFAIRDSEVILSENGWNSVRDTSASSYVATDRKDEGVLFWLKNTLKPDLTEPVLVTSTTPVPIPHKWLESYASAFGDGDFEKAANSTGKNGRPVWESYVMGLDPNDANSDLKIIISIDKDCKPVVSWKPDMSNAYPPRVYTIYGKESFEDDKWWPVDGTSGRNFRFFNVTVEMQ